MLAMDFVFDGLNLSDFGFIICDFDPSSGADPVSAGSQLSFTKISMNKGRKHSLINSRYEECLTLTFDICKDPEQFDYDEREISGNEFREISKWLNRGVFKKFCVVDEDSEYAVYYNASFNIEKILIASKLYGMRLTMETDRPFGYGDYIKKELDFTNIETDNTRLVYAQSDELGLIYPDMVIECMESGDLQISNKLEFIDFVIKNCSVGEVITVFGETKIIQSSYDSHDLCRDFNFSFLGLHNYFRDNANEITSSLPCKITLTYTPIIKQTPN